MKTLIYVGANDGNGLEILLKSNVHQPFNRVYAFEPDPEMFEKLVNRFKHLGSNFVLINAACSDKDGFEKFYITPNRVSSSLGEINMTNQDAIEGGHSGGKPAFKVIDVETINLYNFCIKNNIEEVEFLQTDCQGSDFAVLKSMKPYFDNKKIKRLYCETHRDNFEIYVGLDNSFSNFKQLLEPNYEIHHFKSLKDKLIHKDDMEELSKHHEWDTYWILKK